MPQRKTNKHLRCGISRNVIIRCGNVAVNRKMAARSDPPEPKIQPCDICELQSGYTQTRFQKPMLDETKSKCIALSMFRLSVSLSPTTVRGVTNIDAFQAQQ